MPVAYRPGSTGEARSKAEDAYGPFLLELVTVVVKTTPAVTIKTAVT